MEATAQRKRYKGKLLHGLREARESAALSVREVGDRSGVHYVTIAELEGLDRGARPSTVRKLANALDVTPNRLYTPPEEDGGPS